MESNIETSMEANQQKVENRKARNSGIELLRIVAMLQIIFLHLYLYGEYKIIAEVVGPRHFYVSRLLWIFCRTPVNVFVLISGYFLIKTPIDLRKNYRKIPVLYLTILFYSIAIPLAFYLFKPEALKNWPFIKLFFPVLSRTWYFITLYLLIMLFVPFLNITLNKLSKNQYKVLLLICFFLFSIWPNLSGLPPVNKVIDIWRVINTEEGKSLYNFFFLYIIGGYIRLFTQKPEKIKLRYLFVFALLCIADFSLFVLLKDSPVDYVKVFGRFDNPFIIIESAMIFMFFRSINFYSPIVNTIASTTLGVYLIHEHKVMRNWIWNLFGTDKRSFYNNNLYFIKMILIVLLIFSACSLIELLRQQLFRIIGLAFKKLNKTKGPSPS